MITRSDCILLLGDLEKNGLDTKPYLNRLFQNRNLDLTVLKFINDNRQLDVTNFYKKLRKSYNQKKSKLYGNIVKETQDPDEVLITLSSLLLQIVLFSKTVSDKNMFLKHSRADDISTVLNLYFKEYDLTNCLRLMALIKADLKAVESLYRD